MTEGRPRVHIHSESELRTPKKLVFVHPWFCDVRDPLGEFVFDGDREVEPDDNDDELGDGGDDSDDSVPATLSIPCRASSSDRSLSTGIATDGPTRASVPCTLA